MRPRARIQSSTSRQAISTCSTLRRVGRGSWRSRCEATSPGRRRTGRRVPGGEYQLFLGEQRGLGTPRQIPLPSPAYFSAPAWSPDGKRLLFEDGHLNLWHLEVESGRATKIDTDAYPERQFDAVWSPDSQWIAYTRSLENSLRAIFLYSLAEGKRNQLTDGMAEASSPAFYSGGKYVYFLASTNSALGEMSRPVTRTIYLVDLV